MERTWKISGAYADWTMTISTEPPEIEEDYRDDWPDSTLERFRRYFADAISLVEYSHSDDQSIGMARSGHGYRC